MKRNYLHVNMILDGFHVKTKQKSSHSWRKVDSKY